MSFCHCQAIPDYWMTIVSSGALKGFQTIASEKSGSQSWQPSTTPRSLQEDHSAAVDSLRSNTKSAKLLGPGTDWALCSSKGLVASPNMQQFGQLNRPTLPAFAMVMIKSWLVMPHWNKWNYLIHGVCEVHISIGLWTSWPENNLVMGHGSPVCLNPRNELTSDTPKNNGIINHNTYS